MMQVGDKVKLVPSVLVDECNHKGSKPLKGTVVYVHPKGRFYTVEFPCPFGRSFRESFAGV